MRLFTLSFRTGGDCGIFDYMEIIKVADMLSQMLERDEFGKLKPFAIQFVTCNLRNNTGGEKITLDRAVFVGGPSDRATARNPNHAENFTRNIRHQDSDKIMTIHPLLVTLFNGKQVSQ